MFRGQRSNIYSRRATGIRPARQALSGLIVVVAIALLIYIAETSSKGLPFASYRTVNVSVPNIGHLQQHDPVEVAGVFVGQVESISTQHNRPLAKLQLNGVGPLPVDTHAVIRGYGLLGARYMELDPGKSHQMLPNGATITENSETASYTWGIPDALNLFDKPTRTALGDMFRGFGTGLEGRGLQLNSAIHVGPGSGADFDSAAYSILARPQATHDFFVDQNSGWTALDSAGANLIGTETPAATVAQAFIDQRAPTEAAIDAFPAAEEHIDEGFSPTVGVPLWTSVSHLSDTLKPVLPQLPRALHSVVSFLHRTQQPLRNTIPALNEVQAAVPPTLHILATLEPDLSPVKAAFTNLVRPISVLSLHGCDIQNFATSTLGLVTLGTQPGGTWGPDVGFPLDVIAQPNGYLNSYVNTGQSAFIANSGYYNPCQFAPGPVVDSSTLTGILNSLVKGAL